MSKMRIVSMDEASRDIYQDFVSHQSSALLYHSLRYQELLSRLLGAVAEYYLALDALGTVRGVLPIFCKDGPHGLVYNSLPFYGSNGGIIADNDETRKLLLEHFNRLIVKDGVASATLISNPLQQDAYEGIAYDYLDHRSGQMTQIMHTENHAENLMSRFHHKTRNMVRKGEKSGFTVTIENDQLQFVEEVHTEAIALLGGQPKPGAFFQLLPEIFRADIDYRVYMARRNSEPVAALLLFYFNQTVEYFVPVVKEKYRSEQPLSLIIFKAMVDASEAGYSWWNWGGTWASQEGVYRFKKRWGTVDRPYTYYVKVNEPRVALVDQQSILRAYPNFYVIPFQYLQN